MKKNSTIDVIASARATGKSRFVQLYHEFMEKHVISDDPTEKIVGYWGDSPSGDYWHSTTFGYEKVMYSTRVWAQYADGTVKYVKNRYSEDLSAESIDMMEFMWVKLSAENI